MNEQGTTILTGQFSELLYEGENTNVYSFMSTHNGLIELGVSKHNLIPEIDKDYTVVAKVNGRQAVTRNGYKIIDNRLFILNATKEGEGDGL